MSIRIISIVFPLFAIAALGFAVARRSPPDLAYMNKLNMDVFVPALVFSALAGEDFRIGDFVPLALAALAVVAGSGAIGYLLARAVGIDIRTFLPPMMFNNCGNLGLPLAVLAFGEQALPAAIVLFMVSNLLHFSYGVWLLDRGMQLTSIWRVPSVMATMAGLGVSATGIEIWPPLMQAVRMLGEITIPLMLFSLGARLADARFDAWRIGLLAALARPLAGLAVAVPLLWVFDFSAEERALVLMFSALPPAVLNYIFAERYRQEPDKVASMVMIGHLAAVPLLPLVLALALPEAG